MSAGKSVLLGLLQLRTMEASLLSSVNAELCARGAAKPRLSHLLSPSVGDTRMGYIGAFFHPHSSSEGGTVLSSIFQLRSPRLRRGLCNVP